MVKKYQIFNNGLGWFTFLIALYVYCATVEPTGSFWDCGEYIATAYKLQVGHPPGGPMFQLIGRIFSLFAFGDPTQVAMMINLVSCIASAFCILFLFWSITSFAKKIVLKNGEMTDGKVMAIMGSGLVGALAYTFSDSFWFSAVEAEVYATSSFFTAIVFWAILKWENVANEKHSARWIILIAYLIGLSIGVHLLNLLAIPALAFVYYFKKYETTRKGLIYTSLISVGILATVMYGVIPGIVSVASKFELIFVNWLGMPFNSGTLIYALLILGVIVWGLNATKKRGMVLLNTVILSFTVIMIGYSSYALVVIRSTANTPMDENDPETVFSLLAYLNREQYGDRPLFYGQYYNSPLDKSEPYTDGDPVYSRNDEKGEYYISDDRVASVPNYEGRFCSIFPRMWSPQASHVSAYKEWGGNKGTPIRSVSNNGKTEVIYKPTMAENLKFFFTYQVNHMYLRYFMWNFVGRQNDIQGHGDILDGNWLSGIKFIDEMRLGPQDKLPKSMTNNKGMNKFYFLPLILGLLGMFYHFKKDNKDAVIVTLLFFFTGLAIVIYLNQYPYQPRERDYAYAASFYAFAMWIGLGVMALFEFFSKKTPQVLAATGATALSLVAVPCLMAKEGWDDHDRSNRYTARDFAYNYLNSCEKNAIIFTNGDNDTFPLWYAQEVEGIRTDIRVVNLSLLNTDWYITQMKHKAYDGDPVPFSLKKEQYIQGTRDYVPFYDRKLPGYISIDELMAFASSENPEAKLQTQGGRQINYFPTNKISIPVDSATVVNNGTVSKSMASKVLKSVDWEVKKNYVLKNDLMILDLLATNDWKRPVYFAITIGSDSYLNLEPFFQLEGLAYRLVPVRANSTDGQTGRVDTDIMYENVMKKFKWGGMQNSDVYIDENNLRLISNLRNNFARLADALINEGKKDKALEVLDKSLEVMPDHNVPFNYFVLPITESYYKIDQFEKANNLVKKLAAIYEDDLNYYLSLKGVYAKSVSTETQRAMSILQRLVQITKMYKQEELAKELEEKFKQLQTLYNASSASLN